MAKKYQHTKGPWEARYIEAPEAVLNGWHIQSTNEAKTPVCVVPETIGGIKNEQGRSPFQTANAALIAAAPELLEALRGYVHAIAVGGGTDAQAIMAAIRAADNKARAAIAKAKGGAQ